MLARRVLEILAMTAFEAPIVCEGGAFHSDGQGTLLATEQCLLNVNRNPTADKEDIERCFALYIGARKVIWLGAGFADDETDGHVDNIACFAAPGKVVLGVPAMKSHPDFSAISEARRRLEQARDAEGRAFEIVELPQPKKIRVRDDGRLTPASYVNFYLVNGAVIMPAFDNANDEPARSVLTSCFPDRDIMQIEALDIIAGGGGIHCLTQQEPKS